MYYPDIYLNTSEEKIAQEIRMDGFEPIKYIDKPGFIYEAHQHPEAKLLVFLQGTMQVKVGNKLLRCKKGDKLIISGNTIHSATVGDSGCTFFWSEKML